MGNLVVRPVEKQVITVGDIKQKTDELVWPVEYRLVLVLIFSILFIVNLLARFTGDVLVSFGAVFQADHFGSFPTNVYESWNLRGIGYKYFLYILAKFAGLFVDNADLTAFEALVKIFYYVLFITLAYIFLKGLRLNSRKFRLDGMFFFSIFLLAIFTNAGWLFMQAEEMAILLTIGMVSFALSNNRSLNYLSGIFVPLLLASKAITVAYAVFPVFFLLYMGQDYRARVLRLLISSAVFTMLTVAFYLLVIPREIADILDAASFQRSFQFTPGVGKRFMLGFIPAVSFSPFILTGLVFSALVVLNYRKEPSRQHRQDLIYLGIFYLLASSSVIVQGRMFAYHYFAFFFPAFLAIALVLKRTVLLTWLQPYKLIFSLTLVTWILSVFVLTDEIPLRPPYPNMIYSKLVEYEQRKQTYLQIDSEYKLSDEPEVLYLGNGIVNYFIRSKSYLRYFFPLPVQRVKTNGHLINTDLHREQYQAILDYQGNYIYAEPHWFGLELWPEFQGKVDREYEIVFHKVFEFAGHEIAVFRRKEGASFGQ